MHTQFDYIDSNMFLVWLIPVAVFLVIGFSIYMINNNENRTSTESVFDILDKRYANGEIDEVEYLRKKKALKR
ncbi:SHOCT domain-containing protein (plasmid) [Jeotgalibaca sp. MA1X17-3]|uniref:SHOCT domain-containing protein n=1 Tax=Jeotgalibaca sp. MA1X17-3 TaxID=2908211 RepID=UPI001F1CFF42|nr:SHOCT domain-containing protein [Jeotgalibaca sp. MA1X17-3]UJF16738.1 SHOCT domain-containing protein [Jeotgalibaca sp. MA1X17-3]